MQDNNSKNESTPLSVSIDLADLFKATLPSEVSAAEFEAMTPVQLAVVVSGLSTAVAYALSKEPGDACLVSFTYHVEWLDPAPTAFTAGTIQKLSELDKALNLLSAKRLLAYLGLLLLSMGL